MKPLEKSSEDYKMIKQYIDNTKDYEDIKLIDCFDIDREGEANRFNPQNLGNNKLLWHGSRFSNFVGILS